jgi:hypothetical protein
MKLTRFLNFSKFLKIWGSLSLDLQCPVKCEWGTTQPGAIASNDVTEENHSFHVLWNISVACAVGP